MLIKLEVLKESTESEIISFEGKFSASSTSNLRLVKPWQQSDRVVHEDSFGA